MANYAHTKDIIAQNIYTNHEGRVTAEMVKTAINEVVDTLIAGGYLYAGVANLTPTQTNPGSPDANVFYIATEPGTYTNFVGAGGPLVVADGEVAIFKFNGTWSKEVTGAATAAQVTELGQKVLDLPMIDSITELVTRLRVTVGSMSFDATKRYDLLFVAEGLTNTDIDNLNFFGTQTSNEPETLPVYFHSFTNDEKASLKTTGQCKIRIEPNVSTDYIRIEYAESFAPGDGKKMIVTSFLLIDTIAAYENIINGVYSDKKPISGSEHLITSDGVYKSAIFEDVKSKSFTATGRFTTAQFDVKVDVVPYKIKIEVSGLSNTDIDNLQYFRFATGGQAGTSVFSYTFTDTAKTALKADGHCFIDYTAGQSTSYIHLYFTSGYTPTAGNTITISSILALTSDEIFHRINSGEYADNAPVKNSNRLIISDAVYNATHVIVETGNNSFEMVGRNNNAILLPLKNGKSYNLKLSVEGLTNTDIENLQRIRTATGTAAGDYVFDHLFTTDEINALKSNGYCNIAYAAEQDTSYIHLYFISGYTPTAGNTITIEAYCNYSVTEVINIGTKDNIVNFLAGKVCVCFGDSITEFAGRGAGVEKKRYSDYLEEYCGLTAINVGIGGTYLRQRHDPVIVEPGVYHISDYGALDMINMVRAACGIDYNEDYSYLELAEIAAEQIKLYKESHDDNTAQIARLAAIDWSKVDYVTFLGGTNDWHSGSSLGESGNTDATTTLGAVNEIIRLLLTTYPHIKLLWFTPPVRWIGYDGTEESKIVANFSDYYQINSLTLKQFSASIRNEVILNHIPVCDFYNEMGWNMYNFAQYFGDNETHPFRGNDYIARKMANFFYSH